MAQITAANETPLESLPDAPDEEWFRNMLDRSNVFDRQVGAAFMRGITIGENTTSLVKELTLVHGVPVTVANPLRVPIQGIFAIGCVGLSVGTDGKPNGGIYDLAIPDLQAKPSTRGDGSWIIQANYAIMPGETTGFAGEQIQGKLPVASATSLVTATAKTVTSIDVTPGTFDVSSVSGFGGGVITGTSLQSGISTTANTLPASSSSADSSTDIPTVPTAAANVVVCIPQFRITVSATTTYYLIARGVFTVGTVSAWGRISAVRATPYLTGRTGRVKLFFFGG